MGADLDEARPLRHWMASATVKYQVDGEPDSREIHAQDARAMPIESLGIDKTGFQLLQLEPPLDGNALCLEELQGKIYPQVRALIRRATGAQGEVLVFDHILRDYSLLQHEKQRGICRGDSEAIPFLKKPCYYVHNDYTVRSGGWRARSLLQPYCATEELDLALTNRFAIINLWCPLAAVERDPLGFVDWESTNPADVQTVDYVYHATGRHAQIYDARFSAAHEWFYFPRLQRGEGVLFKLFDSDPTVARFALHSALELHGQPQAPARQSCEFRALVFFDPTPEGFASGFVPPHLRPDCEAEEAENMSADETVLPPAEEY